MLYDAGYLVPLDLDIPCEWRLSAGGLLVPPLHEGADRMVEIQAILVVMSEEEHEDPRWHPNNYAAWTAYFNEHHERELAVYDGPPPSTDTLQLH